MSSQQPVAIIGLGILHPTFDRITICSDVSKKELKRLLPLSALEDCSYACNVEKRRGKSGGRLILTCLPDMAVLKLLLNHEAKLGRYRVTNVELAFDIAVSSITDARRVRDWLVNRMRKLHHERGYITYVECDRNGRRLSAEKRKKRGLVDEPTVYFEPAGAAHNLKVYIRHPKKVRGGHGSKLVVRVEFTSKRSRAVTSRFGGHQLADLISADVTAFAKKFLLLEEVNHVELGRLISPQTVVRRSKRNRLPQGGLPITKRIVRQFNDHEYRSKRVANLVIKCLEERHWPANCSGDPIPEEVWLSSPAQIRGRFRDHIERLSAKRPQKVPPRAKKKNELTIRKLDKCFSPIPLEAG